MNDVTLSERAAFKIEIASLKRQLDTMRSLAFLITPVDECADYMRNGGDPMADPTAALLLEPDDERYEKVMSRWHRTLRSWEYEDD